MFIQLDFNFECHQEVGQEWDLLHLYIENNIDWIEMYRLNNVNNLSMEYHGKVWLHWLKQHITMEVPKLHKGKYI